MSIGLCEASFSRPEELVLAVSMSVSLSLALSPTKPVLSPVGLSMLARIGVVIWPIIALMWNFLLFSVYSTHALSFKRWRRPPCRCLGVQSEWTTQRKKLKILLNLLGHWTAGFMSGRLVLCTKINGRNLIQKLIYNVTIWISLIKLYQ